MEIAELLQNKIKQLSERLDKFKEKMEELDRIPDIETKEVILRQLEEEQGWLDGYSELVDHLLQESSWLHDLLHACK